MAGRVPKQLASRLPVLAAVSHVWQCFWELDSCRPISAIPVGMGATLPVREALPWDKVGLWLTERGFVDPWEREMIRSLLRKMDAVYREDQALKLQGATSEGEEGGDRG